jgi:hypothetical protein
MVKLLSKIDRKSLEYVTERNIETYEETVLGRNGAINVMKDVLAIFCDGTEVFRCFITTDMTAGELLSLNGVCINAFDELTGRNRSIIAYYKYYRK